MTEEQFREDAQLHECEARVVHMDDAAICNPAVARMSQTLPRWER